LQCFTVNDLMWEHKLYFNENLISEILTLVLRGESCDVI
jgi:hypothetical protein